MQTSRALPTVEELIELLKRSSLPTVLVEGSGDVQAFRGIEEMLGSLNASFLECSGRETLLTIFDRRSEFSNTKACFVVDKDMWMFSGVQSKYSELICTDGYSIENDIYQDGDLERLLTNAERPNHETIIGDLCRCFAFEVEEYLANRDFRTDPQLGNLIPIPGFRCSDRALATHGFR